VARTAILKAFQTICRLPNPAGGILRRRQDLGLVLTALQRVANMEPVQLIGFSFVLRQQSAARRLPQRAPDIGNILPVIMPGELADIN
jgi:hypothetical protein